MYYDGVDQDDAHFQSINVDWGAGPTENAREDLWLDPVEIGCAFGTAETFLNDDEPDAVCP